MAERNDEDLNLLREGDQAAGLRLTRAAARLLYEFGAETVRDDWGRLARTVVSQAALEWARERRSHTLERVAKRLFWGAVLDLVVHDDQRAYALLSRTSLRLVAQMDRGRRVEAEWEDIGQQAALELITWWKKGEVRSAWSLLRTILRARFLDKLGGVRDFADAPEDPHEEETLTDHLFLGQALDQLAPEERTAIELMDLQGFTRVEAAKKLGMTPGQVHARRRAGHRKLWRWLGAELPSKMREVWDLMFVGGERVGAEAIAKRLGISEEVVAELVRRALARMHGRG